MSHSVITGPVERMVLGWGGVGVGGGRTHCRLTLLAMGVNFIKRNTSLYNKEKTTLVHALMIASMRQTLTSHFRSYRLVDLLKVHCL